jgi:hypothetical protein
VNTREVEMPLTCTIIGAGSREFGRGTVQDLLLLRRFGLWHSPGADHYGEYIRWADEYVISNLQYHTMLRVQGAIQRLVVEAFAESSRDKLLQAILLEPTVDSDRRAVSTMEYMLDLQKDILPRLR